MKNLRTLATVSLFAASALLTGCFEDTTSASAPTISEFESANFTEATDTLAANTKVEFYGKVADDQGLKSWTLQVLNSAGAVVYTATVPTISGTSVSFDLPSKSTNNLSITNSGTWGATGQYTVRLVVTNSQGNSISKDMKIFAKGTGAVVTTLTQATVVLGSNNNATAGSSMDVDAIAAYKISEVTAPLQGEIDAYYAFSASAATDRFYTPSQAKTSLFDGIKNWTVSTSVEIYNLGTMTAAEFDAVNTEAAITALFTGKTKESDGSVDAAADVVVGFKTSKGAMRIVRVNAITPGAAGTVTVKGYK